MGIETNKLKDGSTSGSPAVNAAGSPGLTRHEFANKVLSANSAGPFLTPLETSIRWRKHPETIRLWLRQRKMDSVIISRRRLIPLSEIVRVETQGLIRHV
jgi:hypothetical protein